MAITDWQITQAIVENNTVAFRNMDEQDKQMIEQKLGNTTALHLASRIGNAEIVSIILLLRPEMVDAENDNLETPLHEACRMGHEKVVRLLMEKNQWVASKRAQQPTLAQQQSNQMVYPLQYASSHPGQGVLGPAPAHYTSQATSLPSAFCTMTSRLETWIHVLILI
nr:ankyrin repeat-containing protein At5g02620-like [Tanacetum cinerariifolium]